MPHDGHNNRKGIYEFFYLSLGKYNTGRKKIYSITTDCAPALNGKLNGSNTLFKESVVHEVLSYHYSPTAIMRSKAKYEIFYK